MDMIAIYVDDCVAIGIEEAVEEVINALKGNNIDLKLEENITDY
jgi:hypothetical protein